MNLETIKNSIKEKEAIENRIQEEVVDYLKSIIDTDWIIYSNLFDMTCYKCHTIYYGKMNEVCFNSHYLSFIVETESGGTLDIPADDFPRFWKKEVTLRNFK